MALVDQLKPIAGWDRNTIADGKWMQTHTIGPIDENIKIIASAWNKAGVDDLPQIKLSALSGAAAWDKVWQYDLSAISADGVIGKSAWNVLQQYDLLRGPKVHTVRHTGQVDG